MPGKFCLVSHFGFMRFQLREAMPFTGLELILRGRDKSVTIRKDGNSGDADQVLNHQ